MHRILIIDDEQGMRDLLRFLLEPRGFRIYSAVNGVEGLEMVKKEPFDMIFLDIHMPLMGGMETLRHIRKLRPEQPVIIMSSSSDPDFTSEDEAKSLGVFACFYKPFDAWGMLQKLDEYLELQKR